MLLLLFINCSFFHFKFCVDYVYILMYILYCLYGTSNDQCSHRWKSKKQFEDFCFETGLNISTAINIFVKTVVREQQIPFKITTESFYSDENMASYYSTESRKKCRTWNHRGRNLRRKRFSMNRLGKIVYIGKPKTEKH